MECLLCPRHVAEYSHPAVVFDIYNLQIRLIFLLGERKMRLRLRNFPMVSWTVSGGGGVITAQGCQSWRHSREGQLRGAAGWARWAISRLHSRRQKDQRRFANAAKEASGHRCSPAATASLFPKSSLETQGPTK